MRRLSAALLRAQSGASSVHVLLVGAPASLVATVAQGWSPTAPHLRLVTLNPSATEAGVSAFSGHAIDLQDNVSWLDWGDVPGDGYLRGIGRFHGVWIGQPQWLASSQLAKALRRHVWQDSWLIAECATGDALPQTPEHINRLWADQGWSARAPGDALPDVDAVHTPRWPVAPAPSAGPSTALVIGAGLAGASAAFHLTRRGWQVQWLDAQVDWASGASALPVGLLSPHPTASPTPMSELSKIGMACTRSHLDALLPQGLGWQNTPVVRVDDEGLLTHPEDAVMIEPKALIEAWGQQALRSGRMRFQGRASVERLQRLDGQWHALDANGHILAQADVAVVANAWGAKALLGDAMSALRAVAGQMSWGPLRAGDAPLAPEVRRSHGVVSPGFQSSHGRIWAVGSTYRRGVADPAPSAVDHDANRDCLARLCPSGLDRFDQQRANGELQAYVGVRCASPDRMPLIGAVPDMASPWPSRGGLTAVPRQPGLFTLTALGSRGLTLAAWGGETLADMVQDMPLATERVWVQACDPARRGLHSTRV